MVTKPIKNKEILKTLSAFVYESPTTREHHEYFRWANTK
jgi:hypothetical protein